MSFNVGSATARIVIEAKEALDTLDKVGEGFENLREQTLAAGNVQGLGKGLAAYGAAVAGGFGLAINTAANFEQAMDGAAASLGGVGTAAGITEDQFSNLEAQVLELGASTSKSASEAAQAVDLLAKAGLSYEQIISGGLQAAINLSEATGESLAQSAATTASTMLLYADSNLDAAAATDIWTVAMNSSNASMTEMQTGLNNMAGVVKQTGMEFAESASLIAFFNSQGLDAAGVGTGLSRAYLDLTTATGDAATEIERLGINVFDAKGNFVGFPEIFDQWSKATANMTQEEKARSTALIFSAAAMDVMSVAAESGGDPVRALTDEMNAGGAAATSAAQRMDNFRGALEEFFGAIETIQIVMGKRLLPVMRTIAEAATKVAEAFLALPAPIQTVMAGMIAVSGILASIAGGFILLAPRITETRKAVAALGRAFPMLGRGLTMLRLLAPLFAGITGALGILALAYAKNFGGFRDWVNGITDQVNKVIGTFRSLYGSFAGDELRAQMTGIVAPVTGVVAAFDAMGNAILQVTGIDIREWLSDVAKGVLRFPKALNKATKQFRDLDKVFRKNGFMAGLRAAFGREGLDLIEAMGDALGAIPKMAGDMLRGIRTPFERVNDILRTTAGIFTSTGRLIQEIGQRDWGGFGDVATRLGDQLVNLARQIGGLALDGINLAIDFLIDAGETVWGWIANNIGTVADWLRAGWDGAISIGRAAIDMGIGAAKVISGWISQNIDTVTEWLRSGWDGVVDVGEAALSFIAEWGGIAWGRFATAAEWVRDNIGDIVVNDIPVRLEPTFTVLANIWQVARDALVKAVTARPVTLSPDTQLNIEQMAENLTAGLIDAITRIDTYVIGAKLIAAVTLATAALALSPIIIPALFIKQYGVAIYQAIVAAVTGVRSAIVEAISEAFQGIFDAVSGKASEWVDVLGDKLSGAFDTVSEKVGNAIDGITGKFDAIKSGIQDAADTIGGPLETIRSAFDTAIGPIKDILDGLYEAWGKLPSWLGGPSGNDAGGDPPEPSKPYGGGKPAGPGGELTIQGRQNPLKMPIELDATSLATFNTDLLSELGKAGSTGETGGKEIGRKTVAGMKAQLALAQAVFNTLRDTSARSLNETSSAAQSGGRQIGDFLRNGVREGVEQALSELRRMAGEVSGILRGAVSSAYQAGVDIGNGLANGIRSMIGAVRSAATDLANAADQGARARLQISSPSRVFARHGRDVALGFIEGIESKMRATQDAVNRAYALAGPGRNNVGLAAANSAFVPFQPAGGNVTIIYDYSDRSDRRSTTQQLRSPELIKLLRDAETGAAFANEFDDEIDR